MKKLSFLYLCMITLCISTYQTQAHTYIYRQELEECMHSPKYKAIFNKDMPESIKCLQRNIEIYKKVGFWERLIKCVFISLDVMLVTPESLPKLYAYIEGICKQEDMKVPTIFITRKKNFFNAAAQKLLTSSGAIVIGKRIILETSDEELEAIVAHEIGHIKYNHVNKQLFTQLATFLTSYFIMDTYFHSPNKLDYSLLAAIVMPMILINKSHEKEADRFAYENNKAHGIIKFFTNLQEKEKAQDNEFNRTYDLIQNAQQDVSLYDYYLHLIPAYYLAKCGHILGKAFKWIYWNTPVGPHPSNKSRIIIAEKYLEKQKSKNVNERALDLKQDQFAY